MTGTEYIIENFIKELSYTEARKACMEELIYRFENNNNTLMMGWLIDEPIYPPNADLYDDFCDEYGFCIEDFISWLKRVINNSSDKYAIKTEYLGGLDEVLTLVVK